MTSERATPDAGLPESWLRRLATRDPVETRLRRAGFQALLAGRAVTGPELAAELGIPVVEVRDHLSRMAAEGLVELDERGAVLGCWGLTTRPTPHRLVLQDRPFYTWCAVDAIGIPAALEADARVESRCAGCGRTLRVEVARGVPADDLASRVRVFVADVVAGRAMAGDT